MQHIAALVRSLRKPTPYIRLGTVFLTHARSNLSFQLPCQFRSTLLCCSTCSGTNPTRRRLAMHSGQRRHLRRKS
eukprot:6139341-Pyramimonas_sp.AAC.1